MADTRNDESPVARPSEATPLTPGDPVEEPAVTGRPVDEPESNTTFAERAKASQKAQSSAASENKAVGSEETKTPRKSARSKRG